MNSEKRYEATAEQCNYPDCGCCWDAMCLTELRHREAIARAKGIRRGIALERQDMEAAAGPLARIAELDEALPLLPPVDGYGARQNGHYSAETMRAYALSAVRAALSRPEDPSP